jgi:hypothetical protein
MCPDETRMMRGNCKAIAARMVVDMHRGVLIAAVALSR